MTAFARPLSPRARRRRRDHNVAYFFLALILLALAAAYALFTGDYFGWDRLAKAGAHSWLFLGFIFAPSIVLTACLAPLAHDWYWTRPMR